MLVVSFTRTDYVTDAEGITKRLMERLEFAVHCLFYSLLQTISTEMCVMV